MMPPSRMAALILAAGESSRMGMFKPLARLGGCTFIEEAVDGFRRAGISDVRVVVGHRADELTPVLDALGVRWVLNPDHGRGMYASVLTGLASLESEIEAFFLLPVDIPLVRPRTLQQLAGLHDPSLPRIVYPRFDGKRGHPPLIPVALLGPELPADAPGGLRSILQGHEADALDVDVLDEAVLLDCDTPSDYRALLRRWQRRRVPSKRECAAIWDRFQVSGSIRAHGRLVAEVARIFAVHLTRAGITLDLPLIVAAGLLHDILRHQPDHARAGAGLLSELGFPRVGAVVALHMDIQASSVSPSEAELVYLADKCVEENRLVSLEERFQRSLDRHGDRPEIRRKIQKRRDDAENIRKRFLAILGATPEDVMLRHERSILAASAEGPGKLHLARHGALQDAGEPRRFIGQMDLPLNEDGRLQAERLRDALGTVPLTAVYCSDLDRSMETAEIVAAPHGLTCIPRRDLREISLGAWEGLTFHQVRQEFPREFRERGLDMAHFRPPGGESFLDCACRVVPALYEILRHAHGEVALLGHAGVNRIILCQALGRSLDDLLGIRQDYGCLNVLRHRDHMLEVELLNVTAFEPAGVPK